VSLQLCLGLEQLVVLGCIQVKDVKHGMIGMEAGYWEKGLFVHILSGHSLAFGWGLVVDIRYTNVVWRINGHSDISIFRVGFRDSKSVLHEW
jgi:hypothetical protein